jgi:phage shock protein C
MSDEGTAAPNDGRPLLRRSRQDRVLFGVAGGLGRYLGVDPVVVRIAFVLLTVLGGSGLLLYLIGLIVIPEERPGEQVGGAATTGLGNTTVVIGVVLILVGGVALLRELVPDLGDLVGPALLIALGIGVLVASRR